MPRIFERKEAPPSCKAKPGSAASGLLGDRTCDVTGCERPAVCELRIDGDWLPICEYHSKGIIKPRRALTPNDQAQ